MAAQEIYQTNLFHDPNLISYYRLEDTSDSKGSNILTNTNSVTFTAAQFGNGANFSSSNTNKQLQVATDFGINGNATLYFSFWIKLLAEVASGYYALFHAASNNGSNRYFQLLYEYNAGTRRLRVDNANGTQGYYNIALGTTNWHQIVVGRDASNSLNAELYIDGVQHINTVPQGAAGDSANIFRIATDTAGYTSALYDDFAVFNRKVTSTEANELYNGGLPTPAGGAFLFNLL